MLVKSGPGKWRFPSADLPVALTYCDKESAEDFRAELNLGRSTYVNNVFFRDAREAGKVARFYALKCAAPDVALANVAEAMGVQTRWASFEEAYWVVAAEHLEIAQWAERLVVPKKEETLKS